MSRQGTVEEIGTVSLTAGKSVDIMVEYANTKPPENQEADRSQPSLMRGVVRHLQLGGRCARLTCVLTAHWRV